MIFDIDSPDSFIAESLNAWRANTEFWLAQRKVCPGVKQFISEGVSSMGQNPSILDVGCGEGWLAKDLEKSQVGFSYSGIDFNDEFITHNSKLLPQHRWLCEDFTKPMTSITLPSFDIAVSCLSVIEFPDLTVPFQNFRRLIRKDGLLLIVTLNPFVEILRLNQSYQELEDDFAKFRSNSSSNYYRKEMIVDGRASGHYYFGVLHTLESMFKAIFENHFTCVGFKEIDFVGGGIKEPLYHGYLLRRND